MKYGYARVLTDGQSVDAQAAEQGLASAPVVVHDFEEAEVQRQLVWFRQRSRQT